MYCRVNRICGKGSKKREIGVSILVSLAMEQQSNGGK